MSPSCTNAKILNMKKIIGLLVFLLSWNVLCAQEESRLIINPGRETFVHFPSATLQDRYTVTFFLPEKAVPLKKSYPVIVMLGVSPQQAEQVQKFQEQHKALVVGINFNAKDYEQYGDKIVSFLSRELLSYVDTNYWTKTGPENRILVAEGKEAARVALRVVQNPQLYGALALVNPAYSWKDGLVPPVRTLVVGEQHDLALAQFVFEQAGKEYGPDFALRYALPVQDLFTINVSYLWALKQDVALSRLKVALSDNKIHVKIPQSVFLRTWAILADGSLFDYIPLQLRFSPPYLSWEPFTGELQIISGAVPGTVRIRNGVDKMPFSVKIKLKKQ